jgi:GNAT superfamily N-acetyltransferase
VKRALPEGIELDDDPERVDVAAVHAFLIDEAYWVNERSLEVVEATIAGAARVLGAYDGPRQVGFARAVSDGVTFAYLDDVYVLPAYRGRRIGTEIVRELVERPPLDGLQWLLFTADAHSFYERFGFVAPPSYAMLRQPAREEP